MTQAPRRTATEINMAMKAVVNPCMPSHVHSHSLTGNGTMNASAMRELDAAARTLPKGYLDDTGHDNPLKFWSDLKERLEAHIKAHPDAPLNATDKALLEFAARQITQIVVERLGGVREYSKDDPIYYTAPDNSFDDQLDDYIQRLWIDAKT